MVSHSPEQFERTNGSLSVQRGSGSQDGQGDLQRRPSGNSRKRALQKKSYKERQKALMKLLYECYLPAFIRNGSEKDYVEALRAKGVLQEIFLAVVRKERQLGPNRRYDYLRTFVVNGIYADADLTSKVDLARHPKSYPYCRLPNPRFRSEMVAVEKFIRTLHQNQSLRKELGSVWNALKFCEAVLRDHYSGKQADVSATFERFKVANVRTEPENPAEGGMKLDELPENTPVVPQNEAADAAMRGRAVLHPSGSSNTTRAALSRTVVPSESLGMTRASLPGDVCTMDIRSDADANEQSSSAVGATTFNGRTVTEGVRDDRACTGAAHEEGPRGDGVGEANRRTSWEWRLTMAKEFLETAKDHDSYVLLHLTMATGAEWEFGIFSDMLLKEWAAQGLQPTKLMKDALTYAHWKSSKILDRKEHEEREGMIKKTIKMMDMARIGIAAVAESEEEKKQMKLKYPLFRNMSWQIIFSGAPEPE